MNGTQVLGPRIDRIQRASLLCGAIGVLACVMGVFITPQQFLISYLWAYIFCFTIAVGSLALLMLYHLVGGAWGVVVQRTLEAASRTLPYMAVLFLPILIGLQILYSWARPEAAHDGVLQHKSWYLNVPFFIARAAIFFAIWILSARLLNRWSLEQDRTGDPRLVSRMRMVSAPGLVIWGFTLTFASIDWVMSLEPYWASSIYGGFFIVGSGLSALAAAIAVLKALADYEPLSGVVSVKAFHDLGNLLLALVALWAYINVSQLIIIWQANLPREAMWYLHRVTGGWQAIALFLGIFHFFLPFAILLVRQSKRRVQNLAKIAVYLLIVRMVDIFWHVTPSRYPVIQVHWLDFAAILGLGGLWVWLFIRELKARPLLPLNDPRVEEAVENA